MLVFYLYMILAFQYNLLEEVVIPSSVEFIDIYAFNGNINLREVIIKRLKEDVTLSYLSFPVNTTVVYDPNYRE